LGGKAIELDLFHDWIFLWQNASVIWIKPLKETLERHRAVFGKVSAPGFSFLKANWTFYERLLACRGLCGRGNGSSLRRQRA
jgi:hypothetical protein